MIRGAAVDPGAARDTARDILAGREFRPPHTPRPLQGVIEWIGDRVNDGADAVGRFLDDVFGPLFRLVPGPLGTVLGVIIVVGFLAFAIWLTTRNRVRRHAATGTPPTDHGARADNPDALEHEAVAAAVAGDYERAIRLRYRAGLVRLDRAGAVDVRPWSTNAALARRLHSARFDRIADTFDAVAFGEASVDATVVASAVDDWSTLLREVSAR